MNTPTPSHPEVAQGDALLPCPFCGNEDHAENCYFTLSDRSAESPGDMALFRQVQGAWNTRAALTAATDKTAGASAPVLRLEIDFKQATELLAMFGGEPGSVTLLTGAGHSGSGLYAHYTDYPEEGAEFLGQADDEAAPAVSQQAPGAALPAVGQEAGAVDMAALQAAHRLGFLRAAGWMQKDSLFSDVNTPTYRKDRDHDLSTFSLAAPGAAIAAREQEEVNLPEGWVPLVIAHEPGYPEEVAFGPQIMMDRLKKWLDRHFANIAEPLLQAVEVGEREAFDATLKTMPEWAPEFEVHRAWVEVFAWNVWQARASLPSSTADEDLLEVVRLLSLATNEGDDVAQGTHYVGRDGVIRCKGSFLDTIERARNALLKAAPTAPKEQAS